MTEQTPTSGVMFMTRRQALQTVLVTGGSLIAGDWLAACSDTSTQSSSSLTPTPRDKTLLINGYPFTIYDSFNPFIPNGQEYYGGFLQIANEYLFYYDLATGEMKPWLAQSWHYSANNTRLTLALNPKAQWSDGVPFTSKDVQFTIEMLMNNPALSGSDTYTAIVKQVTAPDDHTVVFDLNTSDPRFHYSLVCCVINGQTIVPQHIWSKQDPTTFKNNPPVATGPYKLGRAIPSAEMFIWQKNANYWNKDVLDPQPEYVVYRTAPIADSEIEEFKRGQVDVPSGSLDYTHATALKNSGYQNIIIETRFRDPNPRAFAINCDPSKGLLAEPKLHWAISYLVDRKLLATSVSSVPTVPAQFPWADYSSNAKWSDAELAAKYPITYDPPRAAALLDELGAKKGSNGIRAYNGQQLQYEIITSTPQGQPEYINGQKLADELTKIGIPTTIRYYSDAIFSHKMSYGDFDIAVSWFSGSVFDPVTTYQPFEIKNTKPIGQDASSGGNYVRARYKDLDSLANQLETVDPQDPKTLELFNQALEAFYKNLPYVPIYQQSYANSYNTSYWTGWPTNANLYDVPSSAWGQFIFILGNLKATGAS